MFCELEDKIFNARSEDFESLTLDLFHLQYRQNHLYKSFVNALKVDPESVDNVASIPFIPVSFFKNHDITTGSFSPEVIFESSGTTQTGNSRHLVKSVDLYRKSFTLAFELFYGRARDWCIVGLLPSYLERKNSSLVLMVNDLIQMSGDPGSGFYLYDHERLVDLLRKNEAAAKKTMLIGVTFALLDLAEKYKLKLRHTVVMETGGMKGRRKEITRTEVHQLLQSSWRLDSVHSEYGMTELLSQAYSAGDGILRCPPWMKVVLRDEDDPLTLRAANSKKTESGLINVIDLANIYSCAFIATDDIGKLHVDGSFEVIGRMDSSDVRGCSLMYDA